MRHSALSLGVSLLWCALLCGCGDTADDSRIPNAPVHLDLGNQGYWDVYGVHGLGQSREFVNIGGTRIPGNFPFNANSYTGFAGLLLVTDIENRPLVYDMCCPVERERTTRVRFDADKLLAVCPECKSEYNVCEFSGSPVSGPAYAKRWGLRRYTVTPSPYGGYVIVP